MSVGWLEGPTWNMISCTPSRWINCVALTVYTQFTNMAAGRIIQTSGLRVGDPWLRWMLFSLGSTEDHRPNKQTKYSSLLLCDAAYDCVQVPTLRRTITEDHATYTFSIDILLGILWKKEQQTPPKLWLVYTNVHITLSKKSRIFVSTTVRASNFAKYKLPLSNFELRHPRCVCNIRYG